jgi:hypothetical protein
LAERPILEVARPIFVEEWRTENARREYNLKGFRKWTQKHVLVNLLHLPGD